MPFPMSTQHMRASNKATALRALHRSHEMHVIKLENMKASIDMKQPKVYPHVQYNAKRMQMEAERNSAIERENKILLGKMYTIMNSEPAYKTEDRPAVTSLNMTVRKQEYDRIARENQQIMTRILQREPHFNRQSLEDDWKVTKRYLHNISEYPFILGNLPPATRKRTLKPLVTSSASAAADDPEDVEVRVETVVEGEEVKTQTIVHSESVEAAKAPAALVTHVAAEQELDAEPTQPAEAQAAPEEAAVEPDPEPDPVPEPEAESSQPAEAEGAPADAAESAAEEPPPE
jgi:hypothetical protein|eukprot:CAMPEP_0181197974 /NCGR_PEP_ID=MMETSP1096-20121128/16349_1 /TAXON_ID=156174 ORGANISM="Chrysochromulina ericina, Strain CCMP281" /NCGR_SAMPLE_ID=MMETSP1096 /ASSEMBLY_ACC=CAM_ASM_000453 /LENGTH=288 /DNA_ID=CAMNT_0023287965 /DNA_START=74 /DNA_END=940 /DNA_ORIENTATION=-